MLGIDLFPDDDDGGTVFRDVIMLALLGFVAIVILLIPHINPEAKIADAERAPGNVIVEIRWPDELDTDVDLWVEAPGDRAVGYSSTSGRFFNLLRDDLGRRGDATDVNFEVAYSRGVPEGEYTVNLHLYDNLAKRLPIPVTVVTSIKKTAKHQSKQILASEVMLSRLGQEITVYRFKLGKDGDLVAGSVHSLPKPLRAGKKR